MNNPFLSLLAQLKASSPLRHVAFRHFYFGTIGSALVFFGCRAAGYSTAWGSLWSLLAGLSLMIVVSRWTPPEPEEALARIFLPLYTPVDEEDRLGDLEGQPQQGQA